MCFNKSSGGAKFPGWGKILQQPEWGGSSRQQPTNSASAMLTPLSRPGTTIGTTDVYGNQPGTPEGGGAGMLSGQGYNDLMTQAQAITPETAGMRSWMPSTIHKLFGMPGKTGQLLTPVPGAPYYYDPYTMADIERMKLLPPFIMESYGEPPTGGYTPEVRIEIETLMRQIKGMGGDRIKYV